MNDPSLGEIAMMAVLSVLGSGQFLLVAFVAVMVVLLWRRQSRILKLLSGDRDGGSSGRS